MAQCASRSIRRHWLNTTTLRRWATAIWLSSSRSSRSFGLDSPRSVESEGRSILDRSGHIASKRSCARPLAMIRWVVSSVMSRRNSAWVSGRRFDRARSCAIGRLSSSCSSSCSAVISMGIRVSVRGGSWDSTSWRTRRSMQPARRWRSVSRLRAPPISALPSTGVVCHGTRRHFGSSARSSTHSTIEASSSSRFSIGVPVRTSRYGGSSRFTVSAVLVAQFLIRWASSRTTRSGAQSRTASRSRMSCS